ITRTKKGRKLIAEALKKGTFINLELDTSKEKHVKNLLLQYSISKIERKENFMKTKFGPLKEVKSTV
ncbi:unnamed protein product, partial [marine sediment metagenome]